MECARELLPEYSDLVVWAEGADLIAAPEAHSLMHSTLTRPKSASRAVGEAHRIRVLLKRIFTRLAVHGTTGRGQLAQFNRHFGAATEELRVVHRDDGLCWVWSDRETDLRRIVRPVIWSAAELLADSTMLSKLRLCDGRMCGWLFLDLSRSQMRRWCDMRVCGNRAKVRRYYERRRKTHQSLVGD
jgi:predicted RNA-binding Zn ribbon-like protein